MEVLIVVAIIVVLAGVGAFYLFPQLDKAKEQKAYSDVKALTQAAGIYRTNNNGKLPPSLDALATVQPSGDKPIIKRDALFDPWENPYKYDPSGSRNGGMEPDIWCETPEGKVIGNWPKR
jgi:type II secretory pathway pseudopilin PulG